MILPALCYNPCMARVNCNDLSNYAYNLWGDYGPSGEKEWAAAFSACALNVISVPLGIVAGACYLTYKWSTLSDANAVQRIYTPPKDRDFDWEPFSGKIEQLKKDASILGVTVVPKRDSNELAPVYVKKGNS